MSWPKLKLSITGRLVKTKQERDLQRMNELREKIFSTNTPMPEVDRAAIEAVEIIKKKDFDFTLCPMCGEYSSDPLWCSECLQRMKAQ